MENALKSFAPRLAECLRGCLARDMKLPFHVAAVAVNGSILCARYIAQLGSADLAFEIVT